MKNRWDKPLLLSSIIALVVGIDQLTKYLVWMYAREQSLITWHENYGISFSIELPTSIAITLIVGFILVLLYLFFLNHKYSFIYYLGLTLSLGGGISNLIDRLTFGFVRDFISISILPVFNLADVSIIIGVILIMVGVLKYGQQNEKI